MTVATLDDINTALQALGLPTYNDVAFSLCDVLDGDSDHHILCDSGLDSNSADRVIATRNKVRALWLASLQS